MIYNILSILKKQLCNFVTCVFFVHFRLAIMKDRHNMENDLTLSHRMTTFIDPEEEVF